MCLDAGAAEGRIRGRGSAVEDEDGQVCQMGVSCMIKSDFVWR